MLELVTCADPENDRIDDRVGPPEAGNLLTKLNEMVRDQSNAKMSQANKILFLNAIGAELSKEYILTKIDTIITASDVERYALDTDCAGAIHSVYKKDSIDRVWLTLKDPADLDSQYVPEVGQVTMAFMDGEKTLGVAGMPTEAETLIVRYYAGPAALSGDSVEWEIPDGFELCGLQLTAAVILDGFSLTWAINKAAAYRKVAYDKLDRLKGSTPVQRSQGDAP